MSKPINIIVCGSLVPDPLQTLEPVATPQGPGLKNETRLKLARVRPATLAQASRIDGMTPAEIGLLQVLLARRNREQNAAASGKEILQP